eukprot:RCo001861
MDVLLHIHPSSPPSTRPSFPPSCCTFPSVERCIHSQYILCAPPPSLPCPFLLAISSVLIWCTATSSAESEHLAGDACPCLPLPLPFSCMCQQRMDTTCYGTTPYLGASLPLHKQAPRFSFCTSECHAEIDLASDSITQYLAGCRAVDVLLKKKK